MTMCLHESTISWFLLRIEELIALLLHMLPVHKKCTSASIVSHTHLHTYQMHPVTGVCCQMTASPCLLPPQPLLKETVTWPGLAKTNAFPLTFQLVVAPTWSWGRNLSFQKEVLRAWLRSAPVADVLNLAPVTPRQPAPLPPLPTVGPLCPQLPLLQLHRRLQHHPGWVEAAVTVVTQNMISAKFSHSFL